MLCDLFCRVIDNFGDIGVSWRLAADLASRGERVRLWTDDASALAWLAPQGAAAVAVAAFGAAASAEPGDLVIEAFGCEPPAPFLARMASAPAGRRPVWIDLEYLSAEPYVERSHGLPSPQQHGPAAGLTRWFYFPGFTARTGGLIREPALGALDAGFDRDAWLAARGATRRAGERVASLFCYANPRLPALLGALADRPTLLLATAGAAADGVLAALGPALARGALRAHALPLLAQPQYDRLLHACDLNFVRGEDSLVRALWAGRAFVWHAYAQSDGAHAAKVDAMLAASRAPADVAAFTRWWNGLPQGTAAQAPRASPPVPADPGAADAVRRFRAELLAQPDLTSQLLRFASERR